MSETVAAPPKGLELFAASRGRTPLQITGTRATALGKMGIRSIQDLLQHYPRRHIDRTQLRTIRDLKMAAAQGEAGEVTVHATVKSISRPFSPRTKKPGAKK